MKGKRIFICYTGQELCAVLPFNNGRPFDGWFALFGQVTEEHSHGIWFRLEKIWRDNVPLRIEPPETDDYFIPWQALKRVILAKEDAPPAAPPTGVYL